MNDPVAGKASTMEPCMRVETLLPKRAKLANDKELLMHIKSEMLISSFILLEPNTDKVDETTTESCRLAQMIV